MRDLTRFLTTTQALSATGDGERALIGSSKAIISAFRQANQVAPAGFTGIFGKKSRTSCGHDPKAPRAAERPKHHRRRPYLLENAIAAVNQFVYTQYQLWLPALKNRSGKKKRTDRLEAICAILTICLHYTCLATLRISKGRDSGGVIPPSLEELAQAAKLPVWRASRALKDLEKADYLKQERRMNKRDRGGYFSLNALRSFTRKFFYSLGIKPKRLAEGAHWKKESEWMKKPHRKKWITQITDFVSSQRHTATIITPHRGIDEIKLQFEIEQTEIKKLHAEKYPDQTFYDLMKLANANKLTLLQFLWLPRPEPPS